MASDFDAEHTQSSDGVDGKKTVNDNTTSDKNFLTFKDWKNLKEKVEPAKNNTKTKSFKKNIVNSSHDTRNNRDNNGGLNGARGANSQGAPNNFGRNNGMPKFIPPLLGLNNFNGSVLNNFNNNFDGRGNNFGSNNCFNVPNSFGFNNFNGPNNNFNRQNNFGPNNFNEPTNNFNGTNNFRNNGTNRFNGPNHGNNVNLPDSFFASDGIYRQKDMMQKPLPDSANPFRNEEKASKLLNEFDKARYTKEEKKKKKDDKQKPSSANVKTSSQNTKKFNTEPKVYVPNPKGNVDGKAYIPKPKVPEQNLEISKEEKKQQWKEYRDAMKPFKNREFYNAKRVVQRLGKKNPNELEEKEIFRLANAREVMAFHKARLSSKYANYVKSENDSNEQLGELYVLKKRPLKEWEVDKSQPKEFENYGNFGQNQNNDLGSGRKILGGNTGFKGFVQGGMLEGTVQKLNTD